MVQVEVSTDFEKAIKVLKRKTEKERVHQENRIRRFNPSPRGRQKNKRYRALRRYLARERRAAKAKEDWQKQIQANRRG